jgi:hypothetical protein
LKISYRATGVGGYTVLADDSSGALITRWQPRLTAEAQMEPLFRAGNKFVKARGNRSWQAVMIIARDHADAASAHSFVATHAAALPDGMDLKIEQDSGITYLVNAVMVAFDPEYHGRASVSSYQLQAKDYTTTSP